MTRFGAVPNGTVAAHLLTEECGDTCEIRVGEADCYDVAWRERFEAGHEFAQRDKEYLDM